MIPEIHEGHRMRIAREEAGLEVRQIAEQIGIAPGTVVNYEKGRTKPKRLALRAWSEITGVPMWWLAGATGPDSPAPAMAGGGARKGELLQLDSNQQPAGYRPTRAGRAGLSVITDAPSKRAIARQVQRASSIDQAAA